jgi:hypothetical protein
MIVDPELVIAVAVDAVARPAPAELLLAPAFPIDLSSFGVMPATPTCAVALIEMKIISASDRKIFLVCDNGFLLIILLLLNGY